MLSTFTSKVTGFARRVKNDPDNVFSYDTLKVITIRDRYLGVLHWSLQLGILIYIIVYVIFVSKEFLRMEEAVGFVRMSVKMGPQKRTDYPFCYQNITQKDAQRTLPCLFPSIDQIADLDGSSVFIKTYYNVTEYATFCDRSQSGCTPTVMSSKESYVANVEDLYLSIDHTAQAPFGKYPPVGHLQTMVDPNADLATWKKCSRCSKDKFESFADDTIPMSDLLEAARLDLSADATSYLEGTPGYFKADFRRYGAVILFFINYNNAENYWTKKPAILYYYRPQLVSSVDDYAYENIYSAYPLNRTHIYKKGIRVIGVIDGQIGAFTFQTLLIQLTTSLALLKIAATVVDLVAVSVLPGRARYKKAKFEKTDTYKQEKAKELTAVELQGPGSDSNACNYSYAFNPDSTTTTADKPNQRVIA